MMNSHVAFVAHNDCLAPLCQHDFFPISFTFQVFDLVYMVDFIAIAVCTAADFTDFGLVPYRVVFFRKVSRIVSVVKFLLQLRNIPVPAPLFTLYRLPGRLRWLRKESWNGRLLSK